MILPEMDWLNRRSHPDKRSRPLGIPHRNVI
jgi:hypothetical protein